MTENNWSNSFIFAAAFYVWVNRVVLSFSPERPSSSLISETLLIFTAPLCRTSSLLLSTMKGDLRTAHRFPSLLSSQCALIFLLPSEQWSHGVPSISLLQMHPLVQILNTACFSNKLFSRSFPISWAWSGIYCYLPSPPARPSLLLHKTQGIIKCGTGGRGISTFFLIVSKFRKTECYQWLGVQDSHQGALPLLTLQHQVQTLSSLWPAPAPEYLHEPWKADLASSLFWL